MAGIYIHIPYCKQACSYCDFYFTTNLSSRENFIASLLAEIEMQKGKLAGELVETIYFGGGTPSLLSGNELKSVLDKITTTFDVANDVEITLEANPDNLSPGYLKSLAETGINRLSVGLQSFKNTELAEMNRSHNVEQSFEAIKNAQEAGFGNISVDLIYGTPWTNEDEWEKRLDEVISLGVQHISCYQLTIEEKTALNHRIKKGELIPANEELTEKQFLMLIKKLRLAGFDHYEVSNFGKPAYYSRHNASYWKDIPYLGLGPAAHSYTGSSRYANIANIHSYTQAIADRKNWFEEEKLSQKDIYNDIVLTGLRTIFGVNLVMIEKKLDQSFVNYFQRKVQPYIEGGEVVVNGYIYTLKEKSFLFADRISSDLFYI